MKNKNKSLSVSNAEFAFGARTDRENGEDLSHDDDVRYRTTYEASPHRLADRSYEDVRPAFRIGHLAGDNPEFAGKSFESIEHDIQRGWSGDMSTRYGSWETVRRFARDAYERRLASVTERENANRKLNSKENLSDSLRKTKS